KFPGPPPPLFPPPAAPLAPGSIASAVPTTLHPNLLSISPSGSTPSAAVVEDDPSNTSPHPSGSSLPFSSPTEISALNQTISLHLARIGAFSTLSTFLLESNTPTPETLTPELIEKLKELYKILKDLKRGDCREAIKWVLENKEQYDVDGELEFGLRKEEFIRILLNLDPHHQREEERVNDTEMMMNDDDDQDDNGSSNRMNSNIQAALAYGGTHFRTLLTPARTVLICSLLTSPLFMPLPKLLLSPYSTIFQPYSSSKHDQNQETTTTTDELCAKFSKSFLESIGLPKESPLKVITDIGSSGSISKILKVKNVMKEKRTEWSASGELPVEIQVPLQYRYHSIFSCPVSKEQSTEQNPPMLLPCGHCIAKESLLRLARGTPTLKCPYCPVVSHVSACVRVHF
ncbi:hypothetical protein JCM5350_005380, partial [Sporobolomyces pararoseus]